MRAVYINAAWDGSLLVRDRLPASTGSNPLSGVYNGVRWDDDGEPSVDTSQVYTFTNTEYTYTNTGGYGPASHEGTFAWDTNSRQVYLKPEEVRNRQSNHRSELMDGLYRKRLISSSIYGRGTQMASLSIPAAAGTTHDFLALGALVTRLDPGIIPFAEADTYALHVSGGEYNVAANLSSCFGMRTALASAMVNYPIGKRIENAVRKSGVTPYYRRFEHDGVRGPNMATVWSDRGQGVRAPVVFYNRSNEAAQQLGPGSFDWNAIFGKTPAGTSGIRWFHSGGIFSALSPRTPELVIEAVKAAKEAGAVVSFDLNYRAKLWAVAAGEQGLSAAQAAEGAAKTLRRIVSLVDVLVGNEEDLQKGLGLTGQDVETTSALDPGAFFGMMERVARDFPNIKAVATTLREVRSTNRHSWSAVLWLEGKSYQAPTAELDVYDRVGGGDGFAAGLFYGFLAGKSPEEALRLGWAHGALLTTTPGDTSMVSLEQVEAFAKGGSARIQR